MVNENDEKRVIRYQEAIEYYGNKPPAWFYVLSHHECNDLDHCLRFKFRSYRPVYICARCFGAYVGFILGMVLLFQQIKIPSPAVEIIIYFFGAPALIDWSTQTLGYRVSNNSIRIPTGFLYGIALPIALTEIMYWLTRNIILIWRPIIAIVVYYLCVGLIFKFRKPHELLSS